MKKWMILKINLYNINRIIMKWILNFTAVFLISYYSTAQNRSIREFQEKYREFGTYFSLRIDGGILKCLSSVETNNEEADEFMKMINEIDAIDIHAIGRDEAGFDMIELERFRKMIKRDKYEELMLVKDAEGDLDFMIREKNGKISDLLLLIDGREEFLVMNISGNIDLKHISNLAEKLDLKGMDHLEKIDDD